jgi:hypothetical protein
MRSSKHICLVEHVFDFFSRFQSLFSELTIFIYRGFLISVASTSTLIDGLKILFYFILR